MRDFYATCHIPFIQSLRLFTEDYEHALQNIKESLYLVSRHQVVSLTKPFLKVRFI
ncbi:T7SS effector LXG polymorphic toxin [Salipaludibacillus sp. LMS25]|uniref:T7SS effector LXG polymorphic toxin n=1 Tax=Salipaludibacillus sp. LMS25 TaxID=2924031 RepID=UPI0034E94385